MDAHALAVLEFAEIRERLADEAAFAGGRDLALRVDPSADAATVVRLQAETTEALAIADHTPLRLGGAHDIRTAAAHAARGGTLAAADLAAIAETIRCALDARATIGEDTPLLSAHATTIAPSLAALAQRIDAAIADEEVRDDASATLRRLRADLRRARARATERLRSLAGTLREHLQEEFVTERNGRPVLAVKASARSRVPGVVHDASGSGQTLFVEPLALIEVDNELRELEAAERDEVARILAELSALVGVAAPDLDTATGALAALDLITARAALSRRWRGAAVAIADDIALEGARHPLLADGSAVPIDLVLGDARTIVISGPNAGGKTVAMKTLGLAACLHQSGLRPPARTARLPVFAEVLADIGDEQSIERSLSTFSGHVANLVRITGRALAGDGRCLVLIDELAAGTDPIEGAAIAQAVLDALHGVGAVTVVTTHFAELKEWAGETDGARNAAVGFDPQELTPTYRLTIGRPGPSHALAIAQRLGLDAAIVAAARDRVEPARLRAESLLAEAAAAERSAAAELDRAEEARRQAESDLADARRREQELTEALGAVRAGARSERERVRREAEAALGDHRRELEQLRAEIREARRQERTRSSGATEAERERDRRLGRAAETARRAEVLIEDALAAPRIVPTAPVAVGDPVQAPELGVRGTIVEVAGNIAEVHSGGLRVRVALDRLEPDPRGAPRQAEPAPVTVRAAAPTGVPGEIDLRGVRADEARERVRRYVDEAHLAGRSEIRIVHGRATGAVRTAVREELAHHPLVAETASSSADGATDVRLDHGKIT